MLLKKERRPDLPHNQHEKCCLLDLNTLNYAMKIKVVALKRWGHSERALEDRFGISLVRLEKEQ